MRFRIMRTSGLGYDSPCEGAYTLPDEHDPNNWYHKWYADLNTLEELLALSKKHGDLIINTEFEPSIEIYDGYRE